MAIVDININPRASFLTQSDWSAFFSSQFFCIWKEALGTGEQGSVGMHLSFQSQQEQAAFIWQEVVKTVARVWKKNIQDKG